MATYVLVHGAMHGGWCWKKVARLLRMAGHEVYTPTLTGLGERAHLAHPGVDLDTHITDVANVLAYEDLRGVILVGHSYGAMPAVGATDRAPERVAHLVWLDGVSAEDGRALLDYFPPEAQAARRTKVTDLGEGWMLPPRAPEAFGVTAPADTAWLAARLVAHPFATLTQPLRLTNPAGFTGPKTYIACVDAGQAGWRDAMVVRARAEPGWRYRELTTGHDAMVTAPAELVDLLMDVA